MTNEDAIKKINLLKMVAVKKGTDTEKAVDMAIEALKEQQPTIEQLKEQPKWHFIGVQKMTEEEREQYGISDYDKDNAIMLSGCPENGQEVIVYNGVEMFIDTFIVEHGGCYFERTECHIDEGWAWMLAPKPPKDGD